MHDTECGPRRLKFFWDMIQMRGYNRNTIAKVLKYTQPGVQRWWTSDDIRFSLILKAAEKLGVKIDFALVSKDSDGSWEQTPVYIDNILKDVTDKGYTVRRLAFIEVALLRYNISKADWAKAVGCGQVAVYQWFNKDDLMWSRVCQFAQAFNLNIIIKITAPATTQTDNNKSRILVNMTQNYEYEVPSMMPKKD